MVNLPVDRAAMTWYLIVLLLLQVPLMVVAMVGPWRSQSSWWSTIFGSALLLPIPILFLRHQLGMLAVEGSWLSCFTPFVAQALLLLGFFSAEGLLLGRRSQGLLTLVLGAAVVLAPFMLNGLLDSGRDLLIVREIIEKTLALAGWPALCSDILSFDPFKEELVYRHFLVGEKIYAPATLRDAFRYSVLSSGVVVAIGLIGYLCRRALGRLLPESAKFAEISGS